MLDTILELQAVSKSFYGCDVTTQVLQNVNLQLKCNESVAILGPSGSGKTTLLQICGLLDHVDSGRVMLNNIDCTNIAENKLTALRRDMIGFVYQSHNLIPEMTALENITLPLLIARREPRLALQEARETMNQLGLDNVIGSRYPSMLSGGENQRVAIARALCRRPTVLLADEPTGNLDEKNADMVFDLLLNISKRYKIAMLVITHNERLACRLNRVLRMREGQLCQ